MEGKTALAPIVILCLVILLSGQQVAAISKFCACTQSCYADCRNSLPRWICLPKCMDDCSPRKVSTMAIDCANICQMTKVCGMSVPDETDDACVDDCHKNGNGGQ